MMREPFRHIPRHLMSTAQNHQGHRKQGVLERMTATAKRRLRRPEDCRNLAGIPNQNKTLGKNPGNPDKLWTSVKNSDQF